MPAASADRGEVRYSSFVGGARARVAARGLRDNESPSGVRYSVVKSERELVSAKFGEIEAGRDKDLVWTAKQKPSILMNRSPPERSTEMEWLTDSN